VLAQALRAETDVMRRPQPLALFALLALIIFPACSVSRVRQEVNGRNKEIEPAIQAWQAARSRLHSMCPQVPRTGDELTQALNVEQENGCYARLAKDTPILALDDWHWHWLPPYQVVVAVHDEELRKRAIPKLYEEYMSGLNRYLAEKADNGEITPAQLKYAFNAGWNWLYGRMHEERILLRENVRSVENSDDGMRNKVTTVAGGLATVATLALVVSAPDKAYQAAPANCYAYSTANRNYTIQCY
jgi:hypothetical protein